MNKEVIYKNLTMIWDFNGIGISSLANLLYYG